MQDQCKALLSTKAPFVLFLWFGFDHLSNWHVRVESKTQNKGKNDQIVLCDSYQSASLAFSGRASALLFSSVCWLLHPAESGTQEHGFVSTEG